MTNKELWTRAAELVGEHELSRRFAAWCSALIRKELAKRENNTPDELFSKECDKIINDLNKRTGRRYTLTVDVKAMIKRIFAAGYNADDIIHVHDAMCRLWLDSAEFSLYLRPSTLYQLKKFDERLALWNPKPAASVAAKPAPSNNHAEEHAAREALIAKLNARPWHDFNSWAEFFRWTCQFPDAASLEAYDMPPRISRMRATPQMSTKVFTGKGAEWAEAEYQEIKRNHNA
jgi:uncharacterized phage protein (TIGR02220 family)